MTILALLKKYPPEKKVKIGAEDGSSWFYCGTCGDFMENAERYDAMCRQHANKVRDNAKKRRDDHLKRDMTPAHYVKNKLKKKEHIRTDEYELNVKNWLKEAEALNNRYEAARVYAEHIRCLYQRDVVESSEAYEPDTIRVVITGGEYGAFWETSDGTGIKFAGE